MSDTMITIRQCTECRRIHPLGTCFYGISNGKITKFPKGHKGNEPKKDGTIRFMKRGKRHFKFKSYMLLDGYKKIKGVWTKLKAK